MNKPKILVLLPFLVQGALSINVMRAMRARGFEVTIAFCTDASAVYKPDPLEDFVADGCAIDLIGVNHPLRPQLLLKEIDGRGIDLVLQIGADDLYHQLPYLKERRPGVRLVDTLYNEFGHTINHFLYESCYDGVIVESEYMRRFVERSSFKQDPNVVVVPNGVDLNVFQPAKLRDVKRPLTVGYVGRMSDEKNPLGFVSMAEALFERVPNVLFEMYGSGGIADLVRQRVEESEARSRIKYKGFVEHTPDALHNLDVLVLPSKFDGRPNIVMEANACGVPVIAAPVGGVPEMIEVGRNGDLALPGETQRISELLLEWSEHPETLRRLKSRSVEMALERFGRATMLDAYENAFCNFVGEAAGQV
ncbi:glycosyltransferase family 4 protein [Paraburkholderia sediminicola]|uniref:glycosyltransferase family 4 protein n=1 Tax=Paraburkholderia domus TaxID=2793075 RepID=UPI001B8CBD08|nr:glycosyltransferase family 4 protein [Paraburkholderia domus]MCI0145638.1 glycosyltransferase family 4 protein [Paraburkholderia sediminicola]